MYGPDEFFNAERKLCNDPATLTEAKRNWYMEGFKVGYFQCLGDYVLGKIEQNVSEKPTTTNADRIRAMDDEKLAEFLENGVFEMPWCNASEEEIDPDSLVCKRWDCVKCALDWLRQEVTE